MVETYIREDSKLIHLVINGEEIITTETHPFYVNKRGFVNAGELKVGDELLDSNGSILLLESTEIELTDEPTKVYNFEVEDFHTYFVGECGVWVHNANCPSYMNDDGTLKPNQEYTAGEHDYVYKTDSNGNITSVHADELHPKTHSGRLKHESNTVVKQVGDDAGHLIADRFGGSAGKDNIVSQNRSLNRSAYKKMENQIDKELNNGQKVTDFNIKIKNSTSGRPLEFKINFKIDGKRMNFRFPNN